MKRLSSLSINTVVDKNENKLDFKVFLKKSHFDVQQYFRNQTKEKKTIVIFFHFHDLYKMLKPF